MDELRSALELATEEELQQLTQILFCRRFYPLDYLQTPDPIAVQSKSWEHWIDSIEERFRYLAADGLTVLKGQSQSFSYRQTLIQVCHYLKIPYSNQMETTEIEAEIFLNLVNKAWQKLPAAEQKSLAVKVQRSLSEADLPAPLPLQLQHNPLNLFLKGSSVIAVNSILKPLIIKHIAQQLAVHLATYQAAKTALINGGAAAANQIALQAAKRGMAMSAARYGAVRTLFCFAGPVLWGWFLADIGWKAIATNYSRVIPVIFALAQIRLTRSEYWELAV